MNTPRKPHDNAFIVHEMRLESEDEHGDGYHGRGNLFGDAANAIEQLESTAHRFAEAIVVAKGIPAMDRADSDICPFCGYYSVQCEMHSPNCIALEARAVLAQNQEGK
jgi:hypothetical protein